MATKTRERLKRRSAARKAFQKEWSAYVDDRQGTEDGDAAEAYLGQPLVPVYIAGLSFMDSDIDPIFYE